MVGVVGAIGYEPANRTRRLQQGAGEADIVDIAGRKQQNARPALAIAQRVELARPTPARFPDRLEIGPPFPPPAERWALICVLSIIAGP